jgi:hypothetical protein
VDDAPHLEVEMMDTESQSKPLSKLPTYLRGLDVLTTLCRRDCVRCVSSGVGRLLLFWGASLLLRCLLDYYLHFNWTARLALLSTDVLITGWIAWRFLFKPLQHRLCVKGAALRLQAYAPALQSRMISTIQLVPEVDSGRAERSLVEQLLLETTLELDKVDWKHAVPLKAALRCLVGGTCLIFGLLLCFVMQPALSHVLLCRYFLSQQAPVLQTQLEVSSGDLKLPKGSDVHLIGMASGVVPKTAVFEVRDAAGKVDVFNVSGDADLPGTYELTVKNAQANFRYRIIAGDVRSREYQVELLDAPTLRELSFKVEPPAYTGVAAYTVPANAFRLIEGARFSVLGQASEVLEAASISFYARENSEEGAELSQSFALDLDSERRRLSTELGVLNPLAGYVSLHLIGSHGIGSVDDTRYPIQWVLDSKPGIQLSETLASGTRIALGRSVSMTGSVVDDYGLTAVHFCYTVADAEGVEAQTVRVPLTVNGSNAEFNVRVVAGDAGDATTIGIDVGVGQQFRWWIEATDNCSLSQGAQIAALEPSLIRVVSAEEKVAELMERVRDGISTIEDVSEQQLEAGQQLKRIIEQN